MPDPSIYLENSTSLTGIKGVSLLIPTYQFTQEGAPIIGILMKNEPRTQQWHHIYGDNHIYIGCEPAGPETTRLNFAFVGVMTEYDDDDTTSDSWTVTRELSTTPDLQEGTTPAVAGTVGILKTSKEVGTGLWINEARTITLPGVSKVTYEETEEYGRTTITEQYVKNSTGVAVYSLGYRTLALYVPKNPYFGILKLVTFAGPFVKNDIEYDKKANVQIQVERELSIVQKTTQGPGEQVTSFQISEGLFLNTTRLINTAGLDAYQVSIPTRANLSIPDVLESVSIEWAEASGEGDFAADWSGTSSGESISLSGSENGNAESSASVIPDITLNIKQFWARGIPTTTHFFYLPLPVSSAQILAKVSATQWPVFKPKGHTISLKGAKVSVNAKASAQASLTANTTSGAYSKDQTEGEGTGYDVSLTHQTRTIPPMIHGAITFTGDATKSIEVTAHALVGWVGSGSYPFPTVDAEATATKSAEGEVSPVTLAATSPAAVPTTGLYLIDAKAEPWEYGYAMIMAEVMDASLLA